MRSANIGFYSFDFLRFWRLYYLSLFSGYIEFIKEGVFICIILGSESNDSRFSLNFAGRTVGRFRGSETPALAMFARPSQSTTLNLTSISEVQSRFDRSQNSEGDFIQECKCFLLFLMR